MYIFCRAKNPRPTFHLDMTDAERAIMSRHAAYWSEKAQNGKAVVFGPVLDPRGIFGIGVYQVQDEEEFRAYLKEDPARVCWNLSFIRWRALSSASSRPTAPERSLQYR